MMRILAIAAALAGLATGSIAQEEAGREEYMIACAVCHGESGKGDGPMAGVLKIATPSLTTLSTEKGGGSFPFEWTVWMIDGRNIIRAHGAEKMPVWGTRYMASAETMEASSEVPEARELMVRGRILSLVYYLQSIQE